MSRETILATRILTVILFLLLDAPTAAKSEPRFFQVDGGPTVLAFSKDESRAAIVCESEKELLLIDLESKTLESRFTHPESRWPLSSNVDSLEFSANGRFLFARLEDRILIVDVSEKRTRSVARPGPRHGTVWLFPVENEPSAIVAVSQKRKRAYRIDGTGSFIKLASFPVEFAMCSVSPSGGKIAAVPQNSGQSVQLYDLNTGDLHATLSHKKKISSLVLTSPGRFLAFTDPTSLNVYDYFDLDHLKLHHRQPVEGEDCRIVAQHGISLVALRSGDGTSLQIRDFLIKDRATPPLRHELLGSAHAVELLFDRGQPTLIGTIPQDDLVFSGGTGGLGSGCICEVTVSGPDLCMNDPNDSICVTVELRNGSSTQCCTYSYLILPMNDPPGQPDHPAELICCDKDGPTLCDENCQETPEEPWYDCIRITDLRSTFYEKEGVFKAVPVGSLGNCPDCSIVCFTVWGVDLAADDVDPVAPPGDPSLDDPTEASEGYFVCVNERDEVQTASGAHLDLKVLGWPLYASDGSTPIGEAVTIRKKSGPGEIRVYRDGQLHAQLRNIGDSFEVPSQDMIQSVPFLVEGSKKGTMKLEAKYGRDGCTDEIRITVFDLELTAELAWEFPGQGDPEIVHFVGTKNFDMGADEVTLTATPDPVEVAVHIADRIEWSGAQQSAGDPFMATVPRTSPSLTETEILFDGEPCTFKAERDENQNYTKAKIWVVEVTITPISTPPQVVVVSDNSTGIQFAMEHDLGFSGDILPAAIVDTTGDIPTLGTTDIVLPPGGKNPCGLCLSDGALVHWDMSRRIRQKTVPPANWEDKYILAASRCVWADVSYPTSEVEGNDDVDTANEDNDAYDGDGLVSVDKVQRALLHNPPDLVGMGVSNGAIVGNHVHFEEFVRLEIGDEWRRVSEVLLWRVVTAAERVNGKWTLHSSSTVEMNNDSFPP